MRFLVVALAVLTAAGAHAQEIVTIPTRPGVTQSFFIANMGGTKAEAAALLFIGGGGAIRLRMENGRPQFNTGNFLARSRLEFIRNGILPVIMDNPSDQNSLSDDFRVGSSHLADVRAAVGEVKKRFPGLPIFLIGTSRSTISVAHLGRALGEEVSGIVLSSSLWRANHPGALDAFDWKSVRIPLLLVHHRDDDCFATLYSGIPRGASIHPLVSVKGGKPPQSGPCDPFAAHGFYGKEAETVDAIAAWMLKKPYPTEIN